MDRTGFDAIVKVITVSKVLEDNGFHLLYVEAFVQFKAEVS